MRDGGKNLPADYFSTGVWAPDAPLRFRHYTCNVCGSRMKTWEKFREHRRAADCKPLDQQGADRLPEWAKAA